MLRKADDWAVVVQNYRQSAGICAGKSYGRASEAVMDKSSKIAGKCAGKRPGKAREVALAKPNIWTVSMANVFNAKVHERWCTLARVNVEKLNNEHRYCIPLCMGTHKKNLFHEGSHVLGDFFKKPTWAMAGQLPKNASLIAATLADAWQEFQEPGTILAINGRAGREQEPCWRKPGKTWHNRTDLAKTWNPAERSGTRRSAGTQTQRNPAEPGRGTRRNPEEEPGGTWRKPGGTRRKKSKLKGGGWEYNFWYGPDFVSRRVLPGFRRRQVRRVPPGSTRFRRVLVGSGWVSASLGLLQG